VKVGLICLLLCVVSIASALAQLNTEGAYAGDVENAGSRELATVIVRAGNKGRLTGRLIWTTTDPVTGFYVGHSAEGKGHAKKKRVSVRFGKMGRFVGRLNEQGAIEGRLRLRRSKFDPEMLLEFAPPPPPHIGGVIVFQRDSNPGLVPNAITVVLPP